MEHTLHVGLGLRAAGGSPQVWCAEGFSRREVKFALCHALQTQQRAPRMQQGGAVWGGRQAGKASWGSLSWGDMRSLPGTGNSVRKGAEGRWLQ